MAGVSGPAMEPEPLVPALAAAHEEQLLVRKILTEQQFGSHVAELTFPGGPVVLTSVRVGAVPASSARAQRAQLLLFASDAGAPATARFLQLCPGFEQPESGTRVVQLQTVVTSRVLLRGWYQTVPLSLYGYSLAEAAAAAPPLRQRRLTLVGALHWLREEQHLQQAGQQAEGGQQHVRPSVACSDATCWQDAPLQPAVEAALAGLLGYWDAVGTSERLMALRPPPCAVLKAAATVADAVCSQLVAGTFGTEPVPAPPTDGQPADQLAVKEEEAAERDAKQQHQQQQQQPRDEQPCEVAAQQQPASGQQQQGPQPMQVEKPGPELQAGPAPTAPPLDPPPPPSPLCGEALLHAATDMVLAWCGMLGKGTLGRTAAAVRCSGVGLAAAVLLCSCARGAALLLARGGAILLDDIVTMPSAPPSFVRHAITACLLMARGCGTLGGAALLGMWAPSRGITWRSRHRAGQAAKEAADSAAAGAASGEPGSAAAAASPRAVSDPALGDEDSGALAAAAAVQAAGETDQELYHGLSSPSSSDEGHEPERDGEEGPGAAALAAQQQWQRERAAQLAEVAEDLLWGEESERDEEDSPGYDDAVPLPEEDEGVQHAVSLQHQNEQQQAQATAGNAAAEAELGDDVLGAGPSPPAQPSLAAQADVPPVGAAGPADATDDDLYADLAPVIPQTDGAADSPPRWRRHTDRADPGERWEMGAGGSDSSDSRDGRSKDRRKGRKDRKERKTKLKSRERSRERGGDHDDRWRGERSPSRSRSRERGRGAGEERRRRLLREEEERRWQEREEEEGRRRQREEERRQRLAEEEHQRRRRQQEEERAQRRRQQEEEERVRRQQQEEEARRRRHHEEQRRRQQEEAMRHRRYQEQQRWLEEEERRAEEGARRRRLQQQEEEARQQRLKQHANEEAQQRRKRERSPGAAHASEGQRNSEQRRQVAAGHSAAALAAGTEPAPDQKKQRRGGISEAVAARLDEAGKWRLHEQQQHSKMTNYWFLKLRSYKGVSAHVAQHLLQGAAGGVGQLQQRAPAATGAAGCGRGTAGGDRCGLPERRVAAGAGGRGRRSAAAHRAGRSGGGPAVRSPAGQRGVCDGCRHCDSAAA